MDRKVLMFAAVGFASALAIYGTSATHSLRADDGRLARMARLEAMMDEGKVQYKASFFRHRIHAHVEQVQLAGLDAVEKTVTEIAPPKTSDDAAKRAAKEAADKKAAADKKKKDDDAKKKKKKKKKKASEAGAPATPDQSSDDKKEADASNDVSGSVDPVPAYGGAAQVDPNKNPETVEEWIAYLFANPSYEKTSKFIQLTQIKTVKSEIFYPVVEKMLLSNGNRMHEFAVMALGSVPGLQSFELLFAVANEQTMEEKVKSQATGYVNQYGEISFVGVLAAAAAVPGDAEMNDFAISLLVQTASRNLQASAAPSVPGASDTSRTPASSATKIYASIVASLTAVSTTSTDSNVRASALNAVSRIDSLLGTSSTTAAPTSTASNTP